MGAVVTSTVTSTGAERSGPSDTTSAKVSAPGRSATKVGRARVASSKKTGVPRRCVHSKVRLSPSGSLEREPSSCTAAPTCAGGGGATRASGRWLTASSENSTSTVSSALLAVPSPTMRPSTARPTEVARTVGSALPCRVHSSEGPERARQV